ncbi:MAG TPA: hypothetical protein VHF88_01325 [Thermoleophilaceae bacterium]|nr:hypothetical protein [Thermoleophilaceae bacterium]
MTLVVDVLEAEGELVAAEAGDEVGWTQHSAQPLGDGDQQLVAGLVAERVVDQLEVVDVEEGDREATVAGARVAQRPAESAPEERAVRQSGERIVVRAVGQLALRLLAA